MKRILFYTLICFHSLIAQNGPQDIVDALTSYGVFEAPEYEFTTNYNSYKNYNTTKAVLFKGLDYQGNPTKVFGWYGVPSGMAPGEKRPAVVLAHGGGGDAFELWVKKWTDKGYIAIALALEGQVPDDDPNWEFSGPGRGAFFQDVSKPLTDQWFAHAVSDVILANSLLRSFPEVDADHIGLTGISWGGIITNVVAGIDNRFDFAIPVYGCGYLIESPTYDHQIANLNTTSKAYYHTNWDPSVYAPRHSMPMLFVNSTNDSHFTMNVFTKTYEASTAPEKYLRIEKGMLHSHAQGWNPIDIYEFANYITKGSRKTLEYTSFDKQDNQLTYTYDYTGTVNKASLLYTTNVADWAKNSYTWNIIDANLDTDQKKVTATLPSNAKAYFVNIERTGNNSINSSKMSAQFPWMEYSSCSGSKTLLNYTNHTGGTYFDKLYYNQDDITVDGSNNSGICSKFSRSLDSSNSQLTYSFDKGEILGRSIDFDIRLLLNTDISNVTNDIKKIVVSLQGNSLQSLQQDIYVSDLNKWEDIRFTFSGADLSNYNKLVFTFIPEYANIENTDANNFLNYYISSITTNDEVSVSRDAYKTEIKAFSKIGNNPISSGTSLTVNQGETIELSPQLSLNQSLPTIGINDSWQWSGPNGFSYQGRVLNLNTELQDSGTYRVTYTDQCGLSASKDFDICNISTINNIWLNHDNCSISQRSLNQNSSTGGAYVDIYDYTQDFSISDSCSESTFSSKFIKYVDDKASGSTQLVYDFELENIDSNSITFELRTLLHTQASIAMNALSESSRSISLTLKGDSSQTNPVTQQIISLDQWQNLRFTFNDLNLANFNQLLIEFMPGQLHPTDANGQDILEEFSYYFSRITSDQVSSFSTSPNYLSIKAFTKVNGGTTTTQTDLTVEDGTTVQLAPRISLNEESFTLGVNKNWKWSSTKGDTHTGRVLNLTVSNDTSADYTATYTDDCGLNISQTYKVYTPSKLQYNWLNYTDCNGRELSMDREAIVGGSHSEVYLINEGIKQDDSNDTSLAVKFTKTPSAHVYSSIRYRFEKGDIQGSSITFNMRMLLHSDNYTNLSAFNTASKKVLVALKSSSQPQKNAAKYFSSFDKWQDFQFTFNSSSLNQYDQLIVIFMSGQSAPKKSDGTTIQDSFEYYVSSITTANQVDTSIQSHQYEFTDTAKVNNVTVETTAYEDDHKIFAQSGDVIKITPKVIMKSYNNLEVEGLDYSWTGPNGFYSESRDLSITLDQENKRTYSLRCTDLCGNVYTEDYHIESITPELNVVTDSLVVYEGNTANLELELSSPLYRDLQVPITIFTNVLNAATLSDDYILPEGNFITIPKGETKIIIPIETILDSEDELDEFFTIILEESQDYVLSNSKLDITLKNVDNIELNSVSNNFDDHHLFDHIPKVDYSSLNLDQSGQTSLTDQYTASQSSWNLSSNDEKNVYLARMKFDNDDAKQSWDLRIGKGGQIYSHKSGFGEAVPPQREEAKWVDEVLQPVAVSGDRKNSLGYPHFAHGAGIYEKHSSVESTFYSPLMASYYNDEEKALYLSNWGSQAHVPSPHKAGVLFSTKYKNLGEGVIEVTYVITNFDDGTINHINVPWGGVRTTTFNGNYVSNPDGSIELSDNNTADGFPVVKVSQSGGFVLFSKSSDENNNSAASLSIVFGNEIKSNGINNSMKDSNNIYRLGRVGRNPGTRNYTLFTNIINRISMKKGESYYFRTYLIHGEKEDVRQKSIALNDFVDYGPILISQDQAKTVSIDKTEVNNALCRDIDLYTTPIKEGFIPLFLMRNTQTNQTYISPDLYHDIPAESHGSHTVYKHYTGKVEYLRLLGYGLSKNPNDTDNFDLLDDLIVNTDNIILGSQYQGSIWVPKTNKHVIEPKVIANQSSISAHNNIYYINDVSQVNLTVNVMDNNGVLSQDEVGDLSWTGPNGIDGNMSSLDFTMSADYVGVYTITYTDSCGSEIKHNLEVKLLTPWLDYNNCDSILTSLSYDSSSGMEYYAANDYSNSSSTEDDLSSMGVITRFDKHIDDNAYNFSQSRYKFDLGAISGTEINFNIRMLLDVDPEFNISQFDSNSISVLAVLRGSGSQLNSTKTSFSEFNNWEDLHFSFTDTDLSIYDQLVIFFMPGRLYPRSTDGNDIITSFKYYVSSVYSDQSIETTSSNELDIQTSITKSNGELLDISLPIEKGTKIIFDSQLQSSDNTYDQGVESNWFLKDSDDDSKIYSRVPEITLDKSSNYIVGYQNACSDIMSDTFNFNVFIPQLNIEMNNNTLSEGDDLEVTLRLNNIRDVSTIVNLEFLSQDAILGSDYSYDGSSSIEIPSGETTVSLQIQTIDDQIQEQDETLSIEFSTADESVVIEDDAHDVVIKDNDVSSLSVTPSLEVPEGQDAIITLGLSHANDIVISIDFEVLPITADENVDYTKPAVLSIEIPQGETLASINITTELDSINEPQETFNVRVIDPFSNEEKMTTITIINENVNEAPIQVSSLVNKRVSLFDDLSIDLRESFEDEDELSYDIRGLPDGLLFTSDGIISGASNEIGNFDIQVTVTDTEDLYISDNFNIEVVNTSVESNTGNILIDILISDETCASKDNGLVTLINLSDNLIPYTLYGSNYEDSGILSDTIEIKDLKSGNYNLCYAQQTCYSFRINEPNSLLVDIDMSSRYLNIDRGTAPYIIEIDGKSYSTQESTFRLPDLEVGSHDITVSSSVPCEGIYQKSLMIEGMLIHQLSLLENPVQSILDIQISNTSIDQYLQVSIYNLDQQLILDQKVRFIQGKAKINIEDLASANYILYVDGYHEDLLQFVKY